MIRYIPHDDINRTKWDMCVDEAFNGLIYAKSWYLDIVSDQWDALVENEYEKIFPLVYRKKWGIDYLYQPPFTQQLGLFSKTLLTGAHVTDFIGSIPDRFRLIEINLNTLNKVSAGDLPTQNWVTHELDLIKSHSQLQKNYSENLRRNLKKSASEGLSVTKNVKPEEVITLFRENRGRTILHLKDEAYGRLTRLAYSGIYKGVVLTYAVYDPRNTLCAGAIFLKSNKKIIFLFSGLNEVGRQTGAMAHLLDSFIQDHQNKHLTLDFEGSNDPGLARFYKSFGSSVVTYPHLAINRLGPLGRLLVNTVKRFRK
jgi:hypothetical protein